MSLFPICSGKYISCPCPYHYDTRGRSNKSSLQSFREGKTTCLEVTLQEEMCLSTWEQMQVRFIMVASAGEVTDDWQRSMNEWKHNSRLFSCFTWWWPCLGLSDLKATTIKWEQLTLTKHRPSTNSELSTPHVIAHRFCATTVCSSNHLYAYFAHVETEVYRTKLSQISQNSQPGSQAPESMLWALNHSATQTPLVRSHCFIMDSVPLSLCPQREGLRYPESASTMVIHIYKLSWEMKNEDNS